MAELTLIQSIREDTQYLRSRIDELYKSISSTDKIARDALDTAGNNKTRIRELETTVKIHSNKLASVDQKFAKLTGAWMLVSIISTLVGLAVAVYSWIK